MSHRQHGQQHQEPGRQPLRRHLRAPAHTRLTSPCGTCRENDYVLFSFKFKMRLRSSVAGDFKIEVVSPCGLAREILFMVNY